MQTALKRDFKFRRGNTVENYFFLEKSRMQVALVLAVVIEPRNYSYIYSIDIYRDGINFSYRWELPPGNYKATYLHAVARETVRLFLEGEKKAILDKYSDDDYRVGGI